MKLKLTTLEYVLSGAAAFALAALVFMLLVKHTLWGKEVQERFLVTTAQSSVMWAHWNAGVGPRRDLVQLQTSLVQLNHMGFPVGKYQEDSPVTSIECVYLFEEMLQLYTNYTVGNFSDPHVDYFYLADPNPLLRRLGSQQECYYLRNTREISTALQQGQAPRPPYYGVHYNAATGHVEQFSVNY